MSQRSAKVALSAKYIQGDKGSFGALRANSLNVSSPVPSLAVTELKVKKDGNDKVSIKHQNGVSTIRAHGLTGGTIEIYDASQKTWVGSETYDISVGTGKSVKIGANLYVGENSGDPKSIKCKDIEFYENGTMIGLGWGKDSNTGKICLDGKPILTGTQTGTTVSIEAAPSDDRLKHNETDIKDATATLAKLKPYVYDMTETFLPADYKGALDAKATPYHKESGFIAQEVNQIPELEHLVTAGDETHPYRLKYNGFLAFLVKGFQEMAAKVQSLEAEVQALKAQSGSSTT